MKDKQALTEKIRKLLALSESPNQHEAEQAMAKASALMEEHQIEMSTVLVEELQGAKAHEGKIIRVSETYRSFVRLIAKASAKIFDVADIGIGEQSAVYFVGTKEDVALAEALFTYLFDSWKSIVKVDCSQWKEEYSDGYWEESQPRQYEVKKYKIAHGQGFADAVWSRAYNLSVERQEEVKASSATGTELIVLKDQLIETFIEENCTTTYTKYKDQHGDGHSEGRIAGENIPLGGGIEEGTKQERLK